MQPKFKQKKFINILFMTILKPSHQMAITQHNANEEKKKEEKFKKKNIVQCSFTLFSTLQSKSNWIQSNGHTLSYRSPRIAFAQFAPTTSNAKQTLTRDAVESKATVVLLLFWHCSRFIFTAEMSQRRTVYHKHLRKSHLPHDGRLFWKFEISLQNAQ